MLTLSEFGLFSEYVSARDIDIFAQAAKHYDCHILVRKTGYHSLKWVGKKGYTGKSAFIKAKTANREVPGKSVAGLVCSPFLLPQAFTSDRLEDARKLWQESSYLIDENPKSQTTNIGKNGIQVFRKNYILETDKNHKHFGCIARVDRGLFLPHYVHGDYDLYAIIPANKDFIPQQRNDRPLTTTTDSGRGVVFNNNKSIPNYVSDLTLKVSTFINSKVCGITGSPISAQMINHGEQINLGKKGENFEEVLAFSGKPVNGKLMQILINETEHCSFYEGV